MPLKRKEGDMENRYVTWLHGYIVTWSKVFNQVIIPGLDLRI